MNIRTLRGTAALLLLGFGLWLSATANAKTLYVDGNTGNDSVTWANNGPSAPWRTIGRAAWGSTDRAAPNTSQAAQAGDRVVIAAGTYQSSLGTGLTGRWQVLYQAVNSGTAGNPITFEASGSVAIRAPTWGGPAIGTWNRNYIVWSGPFLIDETYIRTVPDTGPAVLSSTIGSGIDGATIHGIGALWGDNHNGVRIEGCTQCFVRNTRIDNFHATEGYTRNGAAIMMYNADDTVLENNELFACATGIYIKGVTDNSPMERTIVRYNVIRDMSTAINLQRSRDGRIYQNILYRNDKALIIGGTTDSPDRRPVNDVIANNTFASDSSAQTAIYYNGVLENLRLHNNIFANFPTAHYSDGAPNPSGLVAQHNIYYAMASGVASFVGDNFGFELWKTTFRQDQAAPGSSTANPQFVAQAQSDFRLASASPARTMGVDLLDLDRDGSTSDTIPIGAYLTGNERIGPGGTRPAPPTQLTVQ
jgi:hypothetical protein